MMAPKTPHDRNGGTQQGRNFHSFHFVFTFSRPWYGSIHEASWSVQRKALRPYPLQAILIFLNRSYVPALFLSLVLHIYLRNMLISVFLSLSSRRLPYYILPPRQYSIQIVLLLPPPKMHSQDGTRSLGAMNRKDSPTSFAYPAYLRTECLQMSPELCFHEKNARERRRIKPAIEIFHGSDCEYFCSRY